MHLRTTAAFLVSFSVFSVAVRLRCSEGGQGCKRVCSFARSSPSEAEKSESAAQGYFPDDLDRLMHKYQAELGAPCGYCHEENRETKQIDFASDENPVKETARFMISMTGDINNKYLHNWEIGGIRAY